MSRSSAGPLAGVRVLELPAIGPVPFLGMMLADLGAEIIRIDRLAADGDPPNGMPLGSDGPLGSTGPLGRGRRSIALDLREPAAAEIALQLVADCDILIEGFRPGVAERLGLGPAIALQRNPKLIYGRMTGWGQQGPLAERAGHDITYLAISGLLHGIGPKAGPPMPPANYLADFGGGAMPLAVGLLAALLSARATGHGQVVDAAMVDGASYLATMVRALYGRGQWTDQRESNLLDGGAPHYRCYECADGKYLAVGALEPKFWNVLLDTLGLDASTTPSPYDASRHRELVELFGGIFAGKTRDEWAAIFEPLDACVAPVLTLAEAPQHPHNLARSSYLDSAGVSVLGPTPRFAATPTTLAAEPPEIGADTDALLAGLGYDQARRSQLRASGVIG